MADGAQVLRNVSWIVTGAVCAVALANWTTKWVMLLIPLTLISAARFWLRTPGREFWGVLIGLALCPVLLSLADEACASSPDSCAGPPRALWPYVVVAAVLLVLGVWLSRLRKPGNARR